ncbi:MAG: hypothetical protein JKY84_08255 [Emcibacteraceae bacterium]|nr:hypothetical protein [Emcibacteraceae bacterium]
MANMLFNKLRAVRGNEENYVDISDKTENNSMDEFQRVIEGLPINVMLCDPNTLVIKYANKTSIETLKTLEEFLPIKADDLVAVVLISSIKTHLISVIF